MIRIQTASRAKFSYNYRRPCRRKLQGLFFAETDKSTLNNKDYQNLFHMNFWFYRVKMNMIFAKKFIFNLALDDNGIYAKQANGTAMDQYFKFSISLGEARMYLEANSQYLRPNQWQYLTCQVYIWITKRLTSQNGRYFFVCGTPTSAILELQSDRFRTHETTIRTFSYSCKILSVIRALYRNPSWFIREAPLGSINLRRNIEELHADLHIFTLNISQTNIENTAYLIYTILQQLNLFHAFGVSENT